MKRRQAYESDAASFAELVHQPKCLMHKAVEQHQAGGKHAQPDAERERLAALNLGSNVPNDDQWIVVVLEVGLNEFVVVETTLDERQAGDHHK